MQEKIVGNGTVFGATYIPNNFKSITMADKQSGTGAWGNRQDRPREQGKSEYGNHTKTSTDNRSQQIKGDNKSSASNDNVNQGRTNNDRR